MLLVPAVYGHYHETVHSFMALPNLSVFQLSWKRAGAGGDIDPHSNNLDITKQGGGQAYDLNPLPLEKEQTFPIEE